MDKESNVEVLKKDIQLDRWERIYHKRDKVVIISLGNILAIACCMAMSDVVISF